jgi:hypothetical protein
MSDQSQLDIIKHRSQKQWTLQIPIRIHNEDQIVRRATREPDRINKKPYFSLFQKELICLFVIAACGYFLALELGIIDYFFR